MAAEDPSPTTNHLADPALRRSLEEFVRRRVPMADVDDIVQTVLCDALAAAGRPEDPAELRRWIIGIARHKVADHHRRSARETASELPDLPAPPPPIEERELARWAEEQATSTRDAKQTLSWMAREGEGEKLESIAAEEHVPAARVRQRVSRMRRWMRERWLAELAAVAALALLALLLIRLLRGPKDQPQIAPRPEPPPTAPPLEPTPLDRARALRADALRACDASAWQRCLDLLDDAARLDPDGDRAPDVAAARERATKALDELRAPPIDSSAPTSIEPPAPSSTPGPIKPPPPSPKEQLTPKPTATAAPKAPTKPAPFRTPVKKGSSLDEPFKK